MCLLACTAHAVDVSTSSATVTSGGQGLCKVAVNNVGDSMPAGIYQGQCVNGQPNGVGEVTFNNGDRLSGEFKKGRVSGKGTWSSGSTGNSYTDKARAFTAGLAVNNATWVNGPTTSVTVKAS
jgi:hypothetical protein